jgi:hypothetical protein
MEARVDFESPFLRAFGESVIARRKALNKKFFEVTLRREIEEEGEKAEFVLRLSRSVKGPTVKMVLWPDRWIWIDARRAGKAGWLAHITEEGRLHGDNAAALLKKVESYCDFLGVDFDQNEASRAGHFWDAILMKGPRELR